MTTVRCGCCGSARVLTVDVVQWCQECGAFAKDSDEKWRKPSTWRPPR